MAFAVLLGWWAVVFRIAPAGDGSMTTTCQSQLVIFGACILALTVSAITVTRVGLPSDDTPGPTE